jgi:hypothetical protein
MTLPSLYIYTNIIYVIENKESFTPKSSVHEYNTRNKHDLDKPYVRLAKTQNSYQYIQYKLFNKLPVELRNLSVDKLRKRISSFLKEQGFYSIEEYLSFNFNK